MVRHETAKKTQRRQDAMRAHADDGKRGLATP